MAEPLFDPRLLSLRAAGARWLRDRRPSDAKQFADGARVIVEQLDSLGAEVERLREERDNAWTVVREGTANMRAQLATVRDERDDARTKAGQLRDKLAAAEADRDRLAERLEAAEAVCLLFGWSPSSAHAGDREKATFVLWQCWYELVGEEFLAPERHPELSDEAIAELARERDATRARVRDKLRGLVETKAAGEAGDRDA